MPEETSDTISSTIASLRENLVYKASDADLNRAIDNAITESKILKEEFDKRGLVNKKMWKIGTLEDMTRWHPKKSKILTNRIFTNVETSIPILTSGNVDPAILGPLDNDAKEHLRKGMQLAWEVKYSMQAKLQRMVRHWYLFLIGVMKYRWDEERGFVTENVLPRKIGIDRFATSIDDCEYIWEELTDTLENLQKKFPKKKTELANLVPNNQPKTKVRYLEFWGGKGEWVAWKIKDLILDKIKNPNWDYEDEENNLLERPSFPYLFLNVFNIGDGTSLYDEVSIVEESFYLQEGLNKLEQQILDLNEGQKRVWIGSSDVISEEKLQDLVNRTGDLAIYLDRKWVPGAIQQVQSGKPDASLFGHVTHILNEIDNTFGIHSTTRGERTGPKTKSETQILLGSDLGRMDLIVRNIEQVQEEWFNAYLHMLKVYADEADVLEDGRVRVELAGANIPKGTRVMIKRGSTLPTIDESAKRQNAIQLAQFGMIDPKTLFEEMSYSAVEQRVKDLYEWLAATGRINLDALRAVKGAEGANDQQKLQQIQQLRTILNGLPELPLEQRDEILGRVEQVVQLLSK